MLKCERSVIDLIEYIEMIGDQVGLAVSNSLIYEQLREEKDQLSTIVNELERTQGQLVESEKMASLGRLVAGIAHEINTPLGIGITATTAFIKENQKVEELLETLSNDLSNSGQPNAGRCPSLAGFCSMVGLTQVPSGSPRRGN